MDVVADTGSVRRWIVRAKDLQLGALTRRRGQRQRNQVRFWVVQFADLSALIGSGGIEVAQVREAHTIGVIVGFQRVLDE